MLVRFAGGCAGRCAGSAGRCAGSDPWMTDSLDLLNKYGDQHTRFTTKSNESVMPCLGYIAVFGLFTVSQATPQPFELIE